MSAFSPGTVDRSAPSVVLPWLEAFGDGALVLAPDGRELHRNTAVAALLADEPDADAVVAWLHAVGEAALRVGAANGDGHAPADGPADEFRGRARKWSARAAPLPGALHGGDGAVLVTLRPAAQRRPSFGVSLGTAAFDLTPREAEVARLLAARRSNAEVAAELGVSAHTARHHTECVLRKVGVRSRRDVAGALAEAARALRG